MIDPLPSTNCVSHLEARLSFEEEKKRLRARFLRQGPERIDGILATAMSNPEGALTQKLRHELHQFVGTAGMLDLPEPASIASEILSAFGPAPAGGRAMTLREHELFTKGLSELRRALAETSEGT